MAKAKKSTAVAVFNPIVLSLPNWHPDGPDGDVDGYVIPFVFPDGGRSPSNRSALIRVYPTDHGWRAALRNCQDHAETADQARQFAAAWIRAAEVLENVMTPAPAPDDIVDAEVVEQCDSQSSAGRECTRDEDHDEIHVSADGWTWRRDGDRAFLDEGIEDKSVEPLRKPPRLPGEPLSDWLAESDPPVALHPDDAPPLIGKRAGCPACSAGTCGLHGEASE